MLSTLVDADSRLATHERVLTEIERARIDGVFAGLGVAYFELAPELPPEQAYVHLCTWELQRAAAALPGISVVALAIARDEMLRPHDLPGQAEVRAVVAVTWLRHVLGIDSARGEEQGAN